jgi:uncharacterized protein (TIRG00374 family)
LKRKHFGIGLAVVIVLAAVAYAVWRFRSSGFSWTEFAASFQHVDWSWLSLAFALVMATYVGRALRWEVMLRPLRKDASLWRLFTATAIGFTAVVLFGRAGEPVRPYLIAKKEGVTFSSQIAAWLVERILDLLMVLLIFGIALTQVSHSAIQPSPKIRVAMEAGGYMVGLVGGACLILLIGLRQFRGRVHDRLVQAMSFLPAGVVAKIRAVLESFGEGMESTRSTSFTLLLVFYTILEWMVIAAAYVCIFKAFPATVSLTLADVIIVLGFVALGSVLQIPGVGGGMQIATIVVLTEAFGLSFSTASGMALIIWVLSFVVIVPVGLILAFHEGIKWRSLRHLQSNESSQP